MKKYATENPKLSAENRNLLSVAYKNVVGSRRSSYRAISSNEQKWSGEKLDLAREYSQKIRSEVDEVCKEVLVCQ
jgi:gas vesicle protein